MSRKSPESKNEVPITEAAEKAELLIRGLQSRLAASAAGGRQANEPEENLEWELERYFAVETSKHVTTLAPFHQIRKRVVEGVSEKVLNGWEWSQDGNVALIENEVIERLVEKVFERLAETHGGSPERTGRALPAATKSPTRQVPAAQYSA